MAERDLSTVVHVFIHNDSLPQNGPPFSTREICNACEHKTGFKSMIGAQRIGALWRLYPDNNDVRARLLIEGISLRGITVTLRDKNPMAVNRSRMSAQAGYSYDEIPTTRVVVGNVPLSYSDTEILETLKHLGANVVSRLHLERDRDPVTKEMTRWLTGRRFCYIEIPENPLPDSVKIGPFRATIFHYEQKAAKGPKQCSRCQEIGHTSSSCQNDVICLQCHQYGHKRSECTAEFPADSQNIVRNENDDENGTITPPPTAYSDNPPTSHTPPPPPPRTDSESSIIPTPISPPSSPLNNKPKDLYLRRSRTLSRGDLKLRRRSTSVAKRDRSSDDSRRDSSVSKQARLNAAQHRLEDKDIIVDTSNDAAKKDDTDVTASGSRFAPLLDNDNALASGEG